MVLRLPPTIKCGTPSPPPPRLTSSPLPPSFVTKHSSDPTKREPSDIVTAVPLPPCHLCPDGTFKTNSGNSRTLCLPCHEFTAESIDARTRLFRTFWLKEKGGCRAGGGGKVVGALGPVESAPGRKPIRRVHIVVLDALAEVWVVPGVRNHSEMFFQTGCRMYEQGNPVSYVGKAGFVSVFISQSDEKLGSHLGN